MILFLFLATALGAPASQDKTPPAVPGNNAEIRPEKPAPATDTEKTKINLLPISPRDGTEDQTLSELVNDQSVLLRALNVDPAVKGLPQAEKERRLNEIAKRYERFLVQNPRDLEAVILYGKFLRLVDSRDNADSVFRRADALDPNVAVVKNQLGLYAAEEGKFAAAFSLLERAVELAPEIAEYRYHLGEFLATYKPYLIEKKIIARIAADEKMQDAFRRAAELKPDEAGYKWRYAESFFDCSEKDWTAALAAWDALAGTAGTRAEREVLGLYRARVLIELERFAEAQKLIESSTLPKLQKTRERLNDALKEKTGIGKRAAPHF